MRHSLPCKFPSEVVLACCAGFPSLMILFVARHAGGVLPPRPGNNDAEGDDAEELKAVIEDE